MKLLPTPPQVAKKTPAIRTVPKRVSPVVKTDLEDEVAQLTHKKVQLLTEIQEAEQKRLDSMKSVTDQIMEALTKLREAEEKEKANKEKEAELIEEKDRLVQILEDIADREADLNERDETLGKKEANLKMQQDFATESMEKLNQEWASFRLAETDTLARLADKNSLLDAEMKTVEVYREELAKKEAKLEQDRLHIESQQAQLITAFEEARRRNLL